MKHATKKGKSGKKCFSSTRKMQHGKTRHRVQRGGELVMEFGQIIGTYDPTSGIGVADYSIGHYIGQFLDGVPNGEGLMSFTDGSEYKGGWIGLQKNGQGIYRSKNTSGGGQMTSFGLNRNIYEGRWTNDMGTGTITYANGTIYIGEWNELLQKNGQGRMAYVDGGVYEGQWMDDERSGQGRMTYVDGDVYEGQWMDDERSGQGRETYLDRGGVYEGQWLNNKRSGHGIYRYQDGAVYEGQWLNDVFSGHGIYRYQNGIVYEGSFSGGNFNGEGTMTYPDNEAETKIDYVGEWKDDEEHGTGIMRYKNGRVYNGLWKNGIEHPLFVNGVLADNDEYNTAKQGLPFKRFPVIANELKHDDTAFDSFDWEDKNVLNELTNPESMSFVMKIGTTYYMTSIDNVIAQMNNKNNIKYECPTPDSMAVIITAEAYFSLNCIGILSGGVVPLFDLWSAIQRKHTAYKLIDTGRVLPSTASHHSKYEYGSYISAAHCQAGQGEHVYRLAKLGRTRDRTRELRAHPYSTRSKRNGGGRRAIVV